MDVNFGRSKALKTFRPSSTVGSLYLSDLDPTSRTLIFNSDCTPKNV